MLHILINRVIRMFDGDRDGVQSTVPMSCKYALRQHALALWTVRCFICESQDLIYEEMNDLRL